MSMSIIKLINVAVLDNPSAFTNPFQFEISFECYAPLKDDLEWKLTYIGSAESSDYDQVLDTILVGPIPMGVSKFVFQTDCADVSKIPQNDLLGVTVILLTCSYNGQEFVRVGYYVNNTLNGWDEAQGPPPQPLNPSNILRTIMDAKPRVTCFDIAWESAGASNSFDWGAGNSQPAAAAGSSFDAEMEDSQPPPMGYTENSADVPIAMED